MFKLLKECLTPEKIEDLIWLEESEKPSSRLYEKNYCIINTNKASYRGRGTKWLDLDTNLEPSSTVIRMLLEHWDLMVSDKHLLEDIQKKVLPETEIETGEEYIPELDIKV